jgi:thiamine pyrophosphokinase
MRPGTRTLIVLNGNPPSDEDVLTWFATSTHVIAADGATNFLVEAGLRPDTIIGDFDSISPHVEGLFPSDALRRDPDQETSDFMKALTFAIDRLGAPDVLVVGVEGDRHDHFISALGVAASRADASRIRFGTAQSYIHFVSERISVAASIGKRISVLPLTSAAIARSRGLRWPLDGMRMELVGAHSLSNEASAESLSIEVESGVVAVVVERSPEDPPW